MKKTVVSALATALVVGAASTTFAAANPFSDVPTDHWAYDAVAQLAKDGVVDGYGDTSFRGDKAITRYEMAQIVAKAMTKEESANAADKAMIDKLAAEFSNELNNLGVRVSNMEKKTDNVKFTGEVRYTYDSNRKDGSAWSNTNRVRLRLQPSAQINANWSAKARIDYDTDMNSSANNQSANTTRAYVEGNYTNFKADLGKLPLFSDIDSGMIVDDTISGGQVTFGKDIKTTVTAGRYNLNNNGDMGFSKSGSNVGNLQSIQFAYAKKESRFAAGAAYYHMGTSDFGTQAAYGTGKDAANIWEIAGKYQFTPNIALAGAYAQNAEAQNYKKAGSVELDYKGAKAANKGTFGIYAAYRHLGQYAVIHPTYDVAKLDTKGWEIGTQYTFAPNLLGTVRYFHGKQISTDKDLSRVFGQLNFYF